MQVLSIQKGKRHLIEIVLQGRVQPLCIDEEIFVTSHLQLQDDLDEQTVCELQYQSDLVRARNKAMWLIGRREYSKKELMRRLQSDFDPDAAETAVLQLCESGIVDDRRFAYQYAKELASFKHLSATGIAFELQKKGIDRELAKEAAQSCAPDEEQTALALIDQKYPNGLPDEKAVRRMAGFLQRKGYHYDVIRRVIRQKQKGELDEDV